MYRNLWIGVAAGMAIAVLAGCRAPGQRPEAIREAAEIHGEITVAGCLQQDTETGLLVLTNAILSDETAGMPVRTEMDTPPPVAGAPSTTGTLPPVLEGPRYIVDPPAAVNLQAHSGTQVQVTGRLDAVHAGDRPVGTTGTDAYARDYGRDVEGRLAADEVRIVADTCM